MKTKSHKVPKEMQSVYSDITQMTDDFAQKYLNNEYAEYIQYAVAALCRKRPSPLNKGKLNIWACAITHAIGYVNFLFDSAEQPFISAADLYEAFGVKQSTGQNKSSNVRKMLNMSQLDPDWTLPSELEHNPMAWTISVDGILVDVRTQPREVQKIAFEKGLIPYLP